MMTRDSERGRYASPDGFDTFPYIGAISCASLMFCNGWIIAWTSPTLAVLSVPDSPIPLTPQHALILTMMFMGGYCASTILTLLIANKFGRRKSLLASCVPLIGSWGMIAMSKGFVALAIARIIAGVSYGLSTFILPMYQGEIASAQSRGVVVMLGDIMWNAGAMFMYTIGSYLSMETMAFIGLTIATLPLIGLSLVPDSPYFLVLVRRIDEAESALVGLRGKTQVGEELELIKDTVVQKPSTVFGNFKAISVNLLMITVTRMGDININSTIFGKINAGMDININGTIFGKINAGMHPHVCLMITFTIILICAILVTFIVDRVGRKPLILFSGIVSGLCALMVGVYIYLMDNTQIGVESYGFLAFLNLVIFVIAMSIGILPLRKVIQSEIIAVEVKAGTTFYLEIFGMVIIMIGVTAYYQIISRFGHSIPFFGVAAVTWISTVAIQRLLPETKGKTLLDIQRDLNA